MTSTNTGIMLPLQNFQVNFSHLTAFITRVKGIFIINLQYLKKKKKKSIEEE